MEYRFIEKEEWDKTIEQLLLSYTIFAGIENEFGLDYEFIRPEDIKRISYNRPKPATPLKNFFLPVRENVTSETDDNRPRIIIGIPNCDIEGLSLLDSIYLDNDYADVFYRKRRENTLLISSDCFGNQEYCHCLSYNIRPYSEKLSDLAVIKIDGKIILRIISEKGEDFVKNITTSVSPESDGILSKMEEEHLATETSLTISNNQLPDYKKTGTLVLGARKEIWENYSAKCVSCGACTAICPTCTCFLLIDKPGFEKIKQLDTCQYPGFERVAGGEDALIEVHNRFKNRYFCKYVWKPGKFNSIACTGCGRCIEACIGKINKNEIFKELAG